MKLPKSYGVLFHQWHDGMDAIYAVGSLIQAELDVTPEMAIASKRLLVEEKEVYEMEDWEVRTLKPYEMEDYYKTLNELDELIRICDVAINGETDLLTESAFNSYITTALWSSVDDEKPLDNDRDSTDIHPETLEKLRQIATGFLGRIAAEGLLSQALEYQDLERIMHDLWLTQNGHGAGFWDGDYGDGVQSGELGGKLSAIAKEFGELDLCAGDDSKIHC